MSEAIYQHNGYTESDAKVQYRWDMRKARADAERWANEQLAHNATVDAVERIRQEIEQASDNEWLRPHDDPDRDNADILRAARVNFPDAVMTSPNLLQKLANQQNSDFNRRYYGNPDGKPEWPR